MIDQTVKEAEAGNSLPVKLKKSGDVASKQVLRAKSAISTVAIQNKQRSKAKPNKTPQ